MKYFIIAGEASGDLHASNLMRELKLQDTQADFLCLGGDKMAYQGGRLIRHYRDMAYMGVVAVLQNMNKVLDNLRQTKLALLDYKPDVVILVDYPSFNLRIAKFVKKQLPNTPVVYYIVPKLWAWKTYRIKSIRKYIDAAYTIFPFETEFFRRYNYGVEYVGNPTFNMIELRPNKAETFVEFTQRNKLSDKPIIALLPGSREQEIKQCLPRMLQAAQKFTDYQIVISGVTAVNVNLYNKVAGNVPVVMEQTYELVQQAQAAVVNSGTATLETALIGTPQVVVYHLFAGRLLNAVKDIMFKTKYFSLVNIMAQREVVKEMIAHLFTVENVQTELGNILLNTEYRQQMLQNYAYIKQLFGTKNAAANAATAIQNKITETKNKI